MIFTSFQFMIFFLITSLIYFGVKNTKLKIPWLLGCSYYFYMSWNPKYALLMLFSTFITYLSGLLISKAQSQKHKKIWVSLSLIINLSILFLFKYYSFFINNINLIFNKFNFIQIPSTLNLLLPVGISFYTFQALSYTIDVYRNDVKVEKNFLKYALFVSFFPQLVAGPIEKSKDLLPQFNSTPPIKTENIHKGICLILVGFFYKLVIADRAALYVNTVFNDVNTYKNMSSGWLIFIIATILFAVQIYFDFNSYSTIAKGSALVLGYKLSTNFNNPYFATSIKDFWSRWHISLSTWFKEYLYFPLGGNRKGFFRTQLNVLIVFLVSGLWHGASWNFVIWGLLHGLFQVIGNIKNKYLSNKKLPKFLQILLTFTLVCFCWIFFRANSLTDVTIILQTICSLGKITSDIFINLPNIEYWVLSISLLGFIFTQFYLQKNNIYENFIKTNIIFRWFIYFTLLFSIIIFGIYGPGFDAKEFIYFQF